MDPQSNDPPAKSLRCPRCGSVQLEFCGRSIQFHHEERPDQPMSEREVVTTAYRCEACHLGFTTTGRDE